MPEPLLELEGLEVHFPAGGDRVVRAVDGIDLTVQRGETLGLVGESGCGKSTTGLAALRLVEPTAGTVRFDGIELADLGRSALRALRRRMAMVFQDPYASLDPRMPIGEIVAEPLDVHGIHTGREPRRQRIGDLLDRVGLDPDLRGRYPHEFSGGMRQRVGIARALASEPDLIVLDEPIAALDVSIQAQVMNLLADLQEDLGLTYLFIAHDLAAVQHVSDRIAVMYLGRIVEESDHERMWSQPLHPYAEALLSAVPVPDPVVEEDRRRILLSGDVPSPSDPPPGCNFAPRCRDAFGPCATVDPRLRATGDGRRVACHLHDPEHRGRGDAAEGGAA